MVVTDSLQLKLDTWFDSLPHQQCRAVELKLKGLTNKEIAYEMGVTEDTAKTHVRLAYRKLKFLCPALYKSGAGSGTKFHIDLCPETGYPRVGTPS